ncbi:MAG: hypothetical protein QW423_00590 [Candidatus Aenigmatarchaeota archaeon]
MSFLSNRSGLIKVGLWGFVILSLFLFGFFINTFVFPSLADVNPGQGPYRSPEGQLVPAWVNLSRGDMFFANGDEVFIVVNISCSPPHVCNSSAYIDANFSQIGGNEVRAGVFKENGTDGSWAIFEVNDTVNFANLPSGSSILIEPKNITFNASVINDTSGEYEYFNLPDIFATVVLVNMSYPSSCPPSGIPLPLQVPLRNGTMVSISGCDVCEPDYHDSAIWNSTHWLICGPEFGGATTNFTELARTGNFSNFALVLDVPGRGKINFTQNVSFDTPEKAMSIFDFAIKSIMGSGRIGMNESEWNGTYTRPNLNLTARLTIYNISKGLGITGRPQIFRYQHNSPVGIPCPSEICSDFIFDGENIIFTVSSWSDYGLNDAINVTLSAPGNFTYVNTLDINFTYIPEWDTSVTMENCTLYGNFSGTWEGVQGNQSELVNGIASGINYNVNNDGVYTWNIYCYDTTNQYDLAEANWTVTVDTEKPQWSNNQSWYPINYNSSASIFNITWTDGNGISTVLIEGNWSGEQNYSMTNLDGGVYNFNSTLPAGTFYWKSYARDYANNWNVSDTWYFTIEQATTSCNLIFDSPSPQTYGTPVTATCFCTNPEGTAKLYRNETDVTSTENGTAVVLPAGVWNYVCNVTATQNYTSTSNSSDYIINQALPSLNLIILPSNSTTYPTAITAYGSFIFGDTGANISLYRNDTLVNSSNTLTSITETILLGAGVYNYTLVYEETQNYTSASLMNMTLVNKGNPSSYINLYIDNSTEDKEITYPSIAEIRGNVSNIQGADDLIFNLYRNSVLLGSGDITSQTVDYTQLGNATYAFVYNTTGGANWTSGSSVTRHLYVLKAISTTTLIITPSSPITYETLSNVSCSDTNPEAASNLYRNGSLVNEENNVNFRLPAGTWEYVCNVTETENYTFATDTKIYVVNKKDANIQISPTTQTIIYGNPVEQYCIDDSDLDCVLYRNGTIITNDTTEVLAAGVYVYIANISDNVNYTNYQATETLTINRAPTSITLYLNGTVWTSDVEKEYPNATSVNATINVSTLQDLVLLELNSSVVANPYEILHDLGVYNYTGIFEGNQNYSGSSVTRMLTIKDTTPPSLVIGITNSTNGKYQPSSSQIIQVLVTDNYKTANSVTLNYYLSSNHTWLTATMTGTPGTTTIYTTTIDTSELVDNQFVKYYITGADDQSNAITPSVGGSASNPKANITIDYYCGNNGVGLSFCSRAYLYDWNWRSLFLPPKVVVESWSSLGGNYTVPKVLESISGKYNYVYYHNGSQWTSYDPAVPLSQNDLKYMNQTNSNPYWLNMTAPGIVRIQ